MYTRVPNDGRLDKSDADFVDVIHSSRLGLYEDIGHVDFYRKKKSKLFLKSTK